MVSVSVQQGVPTTPVMGWSIEQLEYEARVARTRRELERRQLSGLVLFHPIRMAYLSGFFHYSTERPMAIVVGQDGGLAALVPHLEQDHIEAIPGVARVEVYPEYQTGGSKHPLLYLVDLLSEMGLNARGTRLGYDSNGYLDINGYDGPLLTDIVADGVETLPVRDIVDRLRAVKSEAELAFIKESCVWGNLAHRLMQEKLALGRNAMEIGIEASAEASRTMIAALGPAYRPLTAGFWTAGKGIFCAGGDTGEPHGPLGTRGLQRGDVLVTGAAADVGGYNSELERTMIIGEPTPEFEHYFDRMLQ